MLLTRAFPLITTCDLKCLIGGDLIVGISTDYENRGPEAPRLNGTVVEHAHCCSIQTLIPHNNPGVKGCKKKNNSGPLTGPNSGPLTGHTRDLSTV